MTRSFDLLAIGRTSFLRISSKSNGQCKGSQAYCMNINTGALSFSYMQARCNVMRLG